MQAAEDVAAEHGVDVDTFSADWDVNKQLTQVQDAISSGQYDALVVESIDGESLCRPLTDAVAEGTVVAIFNTPICGNWDTYHTDGTIGFFERNEYDSGRFMAETMSEALGGQGEVAYISGPTQNDIVQQLTAGIKDGLQESGGGVTLVAELPGDWDPAKGLAATQDVLQSNPDIDGLLFGVDDMAIPSLKAIESAGIDATVVSLGACEEAFAAITDGRIQGTVWNAPYDEAALGMEAAIQTLNDEPIDVAGWDPETKVANTHLDERFAGGPAIVTADLVDALDPQYQCAAAG